MKVISSTGTLDAMPSNVVSGNESVFKIRLSFISGTHSGILVISFVDFDSQTIRFFRLYQNSVLPRYLNFLFKKE